MIRKKLDSGKGLNPRKKRGGKKAKKPLSSELNLGPLTLRGNCQYAYYSELVMDRYSKMAWKNPENR